jgi:hemoglobin/transferrin/lactoferrin receptor protein
LDEIILSVARKASNRKQIAEKVNVVSAEQIKLHRPANGADLVGLTPGVRIQKSQGGGGSPVIRGFEANRLLLVVDGVRMNNAIYRSGHLQNAITINPNNIERVEVIFGSSSVGYGSDALGGVIHYYTRTPLINSEKKISTQFSSDFSSADNASINSFSTEVSFKKWASLTSVSHSSFGDIRMGKNRQHGYEEWGLTPFYSANTRTFFSPAPLANDNPLIQRNTGYDQLDLFQKFLVQLSEKSQFIINTQYSNSSDISRYDKLVETREGSLRFAEWYYGPQKRLLLSPQYKFFTDKKFLDSGRITFGYQHIEESRNSRNFGSLTREYQREKVKVFSLNGDFEVDLNEKHSFSYGFEGTYNKVRSLAYKYDLIINQDKIEGRAPILPIPTRYPSAGSSYGSLAMFVNWVWDFNDKLTLNAGARITSTRLDARWKEFYNINALLSSVDLRSEALTETLALTYRPSAKKQWNMILSNGFRNPNIDDVGKIRENKGALVVPNPSLFPEYAYNFELGFTNYLNLPKNYISVRGFTTLISRHIGRDNYIIFADETTPNMNTILYQGEKVETFANVNSGDRYLVGGSIDGYYSFVDTFSIQGNISFIKAGKNKKYGPLPSISPVFGNLLLKYHKDNWLTSLRFQFSGSKNPNTYSIGGEDGLEETPLISELSSLYAGTPAWNDLSLLTQYEWKENIRFRVGIDNIFDIHYRTFASGISAPGRNLKIGANITF